MWAKRLVIAGFVLCVVVAFALSVRRDEATLRQERATRATLAEIRKLTDGMCTYLKEGSQQGNERARFIVSTARTLSRFLDAAATRVTRQAVDEAKRNPEQAIVDLRAANGYLQEKAKLEQKITAIHLRPPPACPSKG